MANSYNVARSFDNVNALNSSAIPRFVDEAFEILAFEEVPFLKLIGIDGDESENRKREWMDDSLAAQTFSIISDWAASGGNSGTLVGGTDLTAADAANLQVGTIFKVDSELVWISAASTTAGVTTFTVTRGAYGTTAAQHDGSSTAKTAEIKGIALAEGTDTPLKGTTVPSFYYNYHQIFQTRLDMTWRMKNTPQYGIANDWNHQKAKAFKELNILLEIAALQGTQGDGTDGPMAMGGLPSYITTNATALASAAIEEKDLLDLLQNIYTGVGASNMGKTILCGPWIKRKINSWFDPKVQMTRKENTGGFVINQVETDFGTLDIVMINRMPLSDLYVINTEFVKVHPYKGGKWQEFELPSNGDYDKLGIYGDYTLVVKNQKAMGKITGASTTA
jgi:hypothetical protein